MFKKFRKVPEFNSVQRNQQNALRYIRELSDEEWKRFKRAAESYRKSDKILNGDDDDDITQLAAGESFIETPPTNIPPAAIDE